MRATALYFTGPRQVGVEEVAVPDPARDEVLVETSVSAVSGGTELLVYRGEAPEETDVDATIDALAGEFSYPFQYGYSAVGDVVALGADIDDRWRGRTVFAFNPHESHFTATPEQLFPVPADVSPETASLLPTAETAVTLVMDGRPMVGERVVVFGAGVVGLFTAKLLASFPLERLTVVEPVASRRRLADRMGADETFHPDRMDDVGERGDPRGRPGLRTDGLSGRAERRYRRRRIRRPGRRRVLVRAQAGRRRPRRVLPSGAGRRRVESGEHARARPPGTVDEIPPHPDGVGVSPSDRNRPGRHSPTPLRACARRVPGTRRIPRQRPAGDSPVRVAP
ncbi:hypothetical protein ACFQJD_13065 [Haloplanus sp. GCM10025708]|uniref:hypothetical protein n=1 Tax=Haloplanus sp. GCM10025708 TaxID=3252679 RepID=UPI003608C450